jgi:hypothetical protein
MSSIVVFYVLGSCILACVLGALLSLTHTPRWSFGRGLRGAFSASWGLNDLLAESGQSAVFYLVAGVAEVVGVLLPVLILGAFVFKLLRHDPLVWRKKMSLEQNPSFGPTIAIRFYPGTRSPLADMNIRIFCRAESTGKEPRVTVNRRMQLISANELVRDVTFAYATPAYPSMVRVPLAPFEVGEKAALVSEVHASEFIDVQGTTALKNRCEILVLVSGTVVLTGDSFLSVHRYLASDMLPGEPQWIDADSSPDADPRSWAGWDNFESNAEMYLFVYGSLMSPRSLQRTVPGGLGKGVRAIPAILDDWYLSWNVGSWAHSQPEREWILGDGSAFHEVIGSLGLQYQKGSQCQGAVWRVPVSLLGQFDLRERDYDRVDVTGYVNWPDMNPEAVVHTYIPKPEAIEVMETARQEQRVVVSQDYIRLVNDAFRDLLRGRGEQYEVPDPNCRVEKLSFRPKGSNMLRPVVTEPDLAVDDT